MKDNQYSEKLTEQTSVFYMHGSSLFRKSFTKRGKPWKFTGLTEWAESRADCRNLHASWEKQRLHKIPLFWFLLEFFQGDLLLC